MRNSWVFLLHSSTLLSYVIHPAILYFRERFFSRIAASVLQGTVTRIKGKEKVNDMANQQHLERLRQSGANTWNRWRRTYPDIVLDLQGADLSGAYLKGYNLRLAILKEANLHHANLSTCDLIEADLSGARMIEAKLVYSELRAANLSEADLSGPI